MAAAAATLWVLSQALLIAPCWSLILPVACIAWPIWYGQREAALFYRRLALGAATLPGSRIRRWFWQGRLTSLVQLLAALAWAAVLLLLIPLLGPWHLALLALDVLLLALGLRAASNLLARDVQAGHVGLLSRRWLLAAGNMLVLAIGFFVIDYFTGAPDLRGMNWSAVSEQAFSEFANRATCPLVATMLGLLRVADHLNWHLAQDLVPALPGGYRMLAWMALLLQAGIAGIAYTRLQLGVLALVARREQADSGAPQDPLLPDSLPVVVPGFIVLALGLADFDPARMRPVAIQVAQGLNPCGTALEQVTGLRTAVTGQIETRRAAQRAHLQQQAQQAVSDVFDAAEAGVEGYLDWYFSLTGQYQRLGALIASRSIDSMNARIDAELESAVFTIPQIAAKLAEVDMRIGVEVSQGVQQMAAETGRQLALEEATPCWGEFLDVSAIAQTQRDVRAIGVSAAGSLAGVAATRVAAAGLSRAVVARLAARPAYRGAGSVLVRLLGKRTGSLVVGGGTGAAVCAPGGPLALLCSLAAGGAAWITVDKVQIEIHELRFREAMRNEILDALQLQQARMVDELLQRHGAMIDGTASQLQATVDRVFIPARDG